MLREIEALFSRASGCTACPAMGCPPVLSPANGPADARVLFVGEAPGRFGAGRTGVPFSGDVAGRRFERLLAEAALSREMVFVTNAVLCLPLDSGGRNRTPRRHEVANCGDWLAETIRVVGPDLVVAMGRIALEATRRISSHDLGMEGAGNVPVEWNGRQLAVVYHPGTRSQVHRSWERQLEDWRHLGKWIVEAGLVPRKLHA